MKRQTGVSLFVFTILAFTATTTSVARAGESVWDHNGSQMLLQSDGDQRIISYLFPRPGISAQPGEVLFRGRNRASFYQGTAYTFRRGCEPAPYQVSGSINSPTRIVLNGASPRRSGCQIIGYTNNSGNSRLVFTYLRKIDNQQPQIDDEGPQAGPVQNIIKTFPGGKLTFRIQDENEPAGAPIRIDITAQCSNGQSITLKTNHRTCALDGISTLPDGSGFSIQQRDYGGQSCSIASDHPIYIDNTCQ